MTASPVTPNQIQALPQLLPACSLVNGKLRRELHFVDFVEVLGFMICVALVEEAMGHHPEWSNIWNRVVIELTTLNIGVLAALDVQLVQQIDVLV
jgi:4a-hydroxytetrahydrobiopterin dehydratase